MTTFLSPKGSALAAAYLLFSVSVLLVFASPVWADPITYAICNYPASQGDTIELAPGSTYFPTGLGTWTITGTITGEWSNDGGFYGFTSYGFALTGPGGASASYNTTFDPPATFPGLSVTPEALVLPVGPPGYPTDLYLGPLAAR
jgi:hypothetical protein